MAFYYHVSQGNQTYITGPLSNTYMQLFEGINKVASWYEL
jgi:hypothetical protein